MNIYKRIDIPFYFFTFYAQLHYGKGTYRPEKWIKVTTNKKNKLLWIGNFVIGYYLK